jgi:hypothetical protein
MDRLGLGWSVERCQVDLSHPGVQVFQDHRPYPVRRVGQAGQVGTGCIGRIGIVRMLLSAFCPFLRPKALR